jgi:hypothetical protein
MPYGRLHLHPYTNNCNFARRTRSCALALSLSLTLTPELIKSSDETQHKQVVVTDCGVHSAEKDKEKKTQKKSSKSAYLYHKIGTRYFSRSQLYAFM